MAFLMPAFALLIHQKLRRYLMRAGKPTLATRVWARTRDSEKKELSEERNAPHYYETRLVLNYRLSHEMSTQSSDLLQTWSQSLRKDNQCEALRFTDSHLFIIVCDGRFPLGVFSVSTAVLLESPLSYCTKPPFFLQQK